MALEINSAAVRGHLWKAYTGRPISELVEAGVKVDRQAELAGWGILLRAGAFHGLQAGIHAVSDAEQRGFPVTPTDLTAAMTSALRLLSDTAPREVARRLLDGQ